MNEFIEQCRQEWKRLGVPDPLAEDMAAELASDLSEAAAEGISGEELLGASAHDPRTFAISWAAERGVIPPPPGRANGRRLPLALLAFTAVAAIALIVAVLLLVSGQPKVKVSRTVTGTHSQSLPPSFFAPPGPGQHVLQANTSAPIELLLLLLAVVALSFAAWLWVSWRRSSPPGVPV